MRRARPPARRQQAALQKVVSAALHLPQAALANFWLLAAFILQISGRLALIALGAGVGAVQVALVLWRHQVLLPSPSTASRCPCVFLHFYALPG